MPHLRRNSGGSYNDVPMQAMSPSEADSVGYDVREGRGSILKRKKTLACAVLLFLILAVFAVLLFVMFTGVDEAREELRHLEDKLSNGGDSGSTTYNTFVGGLCGSPSYERYLLVTVNYDAINNTDPSSGKPFVTVKKKLPPGFVAVIDIRSSKIVDTLKLSTKQHNSRQPKRGTQYDHYYVIGDAYPEYSDFYVVDLKKPRSLKLKTVINGTQARLSYGLSAPNTIRTLPDGSLLVAMMGGGGVNGGGKGGFLQLNPDKNFAVQARWDSNSSTEDPLNDLRKGNYDFYMQPYIQNVLVSTEWVSAKAQGGAGSVSGDVASLPGTSPYLNFWNLQLQSIVARVNLHSVAKRDVESHLQPGTMPLEVRMLHRNQAVGYVIAAGNGEVLAFTRVFTAWQTQQVILVDPRLDSADPNNRDKAIPALLTDLLISADDSRLYVANWAHGEIRQYDISENPLQPVLCSTLQVSTGTNKMHGPYENYRNEATGKVIYGGPARLQLRVDGSELFYTTSFVPGWDNDFYPEMTEKGSFLGKVVVDPCLCSGGSMKQDPSFGIDFGRSESFPDNSAGLPARAHDLHFIGGDPTTYPSDFISPPSSSSSSS